MKNKIILGLIFLLSCTGVARAQDRDSIGIHFFEGTFKEALQLAKKENKLIFMDGYGFLVWTLRPNGTTHISLERSRGFLQQALYQLET